MTDKSKIEQLEKENNQLKHENHRLRLGQFVPSDENNLFSGLQINYRHIRARVLSHAVLDIINKKHPEIDKSKIFNDLMILFHDNGVEVITDSDRKLAGLPKRDIYGITAEQLNIIERHNGV